MSVAAECHPGKRQGHRHNMVCPHPPFPPNTALVTSVWFFPKVKLTMEGNHLESVQEVDTAEGHSRNGTSQTASEGVSDGIRVFEREGFKGDDGKVSFTLIFLKM